MYIKRDMLPVVAATVVSAATLSAQQQPVDYTQVTRPVVEITDSSLIDYLLFEHFNEPIERPSRLQVIDITENGYGPDDIIVAYPSAEAFLIEEFLPDSVQRVMGSWTPEVEFRMDAGNLPVEALAALIENDPDTTSRAENAIMYDVVQAVDRNYRDLPFGLLFRRDSLGFSFQLWDYNSGRMEYAPRPAFASDSAVAEVLSLLRGTGYMLGQSGEGVISGLDRTRTPVASLAQAFVGIKSFPSERTKQLAARTLMVGTYDMDRSGAIDGAREIDAITCEIWTGLDEIFPGGLDRLGFANSSDPYYGNIAFSIAENVRSPAIRRRAACLAGNEPPPTVEEDVDAPTVRAQLPEEVREFNDNQVASEIIETTGHLHPGSANWAQAVRTVFAQRYDIDETGLIDSRAEVNQIPCVAWNAIGSTGPDFLNDFGFQTSTRYSGAAMGVHLSQREAVLEAVTACAGRGRTASRRMAITPQGRGAAPREETGQSLAVALAGIRGLEEVEKRQLAARTLLLAAHDYDRSGYIDASSELDAISCNEWASLVLSFPGFADTYGFDSSPDADVNAYLGGAVFNISERLMKPAARRLEACQSGAIPPPTEDTDVEPQTVEVTIPRSVREFEDLGVASAVARATEKTVPGSASWAAAVSGVLVRTYDLDQTRMLDTEEEVSEIACVVWRTIQSTSGNSIGGLGFEGGAYLGDRLGILETQKRVAASRIRSCIP